MQPIPDDVAEVAALDGFRLHVRFFDGVEGQVEMIAPVHSPAAGVFAQWPTQPGLWRSMWNTVQ